LSHVAHRPPPSPPDLKPEPLPKLPAPDYEEHRRNRVREETALYLGLFSLTPSLLVLQAWFALPVAALAGLALWTVHKLRREGVNALALHMSSWTLMILAASVTFLYPPFSESGALFVASGMVYSVVLPGVVIMPLFALLALLYGIRNPFISTKQMVGMSAAFLHALGWLIGFGFLFI
jgi:hypothetical protein